MEITKLTPQVKNPQRVNVYVDGEFYRGLDRLVAMKLGLKPGLTLNPKLIDQLETSQSENSAWEWALRSLQVSSKSVRDMRNKLTQKFEPDLADELIERLLAADLLNDARFAEQLVRRLSATGTKSKKEMLLKLRQKGIEPEIAKAALAEIATDTESALTLARIKNRTLKLELPWRERYEKIASYLARKGFNYADIRTAVTATNLDLDTD
jgi:regulatory protein